MDSVVVKAAIQEEVVVVDLVDVMDILFVTTEAR